MKKEMNKKRSLTRRDFLSLSAGAAAGSLLAACGAQPTPEKVVETVIVEKDGEQVVETVIVEKEVETVVTATPDPSADVAPAEDVTVEFWVQSYGPDPAKWKDLVTGFADQFKEESGITVDVQINNWDHARQLWLMVVQGGLAPDCGDWFWLWSNVQLGQGQYGPRPITEYKDELWPDLNERFFAGSLKDVFFLDEFYGIPHRNGVRPMMYRTDYLEEAGFAKAPDTWEELSQYAQALTQRDSDGNVTRWGMEFGADNNKPQQLITFYWQAGGEYMTPDGKEATVDTPEMRVALEWMLEQIWDHEVVPTDFMEKGHNPMDLFTGQQVAILAQAVQGRAFDVDKSFPELSDKFNVAPVAKGPANRATYAGGGYWCVLQGTEHPYESAKWIQFLSRDENMQLWSENTGAISPNKKVMDSDFWTDRPWKLAIPEALENAHTSQHASAAWSKLIAPEPGAVLFDMFNEALVNRMPLDEVLARAQTRMQEEMDKASGA